MFERPIFFSDPMMQAILDSKKTQIQRDVEPQPEAGTDCPYHIGSGESRVARKCPYGQTGNTLWAWVRETWGVHCRAKLEITALRIEWLQDTGKWVWVIELSVAQHR